MIKYDTFYIQCPRCGSWLEGHLVKSEMVNKSILYSDGKTLNDNYITEPQKLIACPACSHWLWIDEYNEPTVSYTKPQTPYYNWNHWRFFGIHFNSVEGRLALVNHYKKYLEAIDNDRDKELYIRRMMWWAYNDLVRNNYQMHLRYLFSGKMSFNVWRKNRKKQKKAHEVENHPDALPNEDVPPESIEDQPNVIDLPDDGENDELLGLPNLDE